jgi:hypothetical protein
VSCLCAGQRCRVLPLVVVVGSAKGRMNGGRDILVRVDAVNGSVWCLGEIIGSFTERIASLIVMATVSSVLVSGAGGCESRRNSVFHGFEILQLGKQTPQIFHEAEWVDALCKE